MIAVAGLLAVATPALAAPSVEILRPDDRARVTNGTFKARVAVDGKRFRAWLNGRNVTRSFSRGAVRTARFALGRRLKRGDVNLHVSAGRGARPASDQHYFSVLQRDDSSLSIKRKRERISRPAPLLRLKTKRPVVRSRVRLNGKAAGKDFELASDYRGLRGRFGAHRGVRFGRNTATFKVEQRNGVIAKRTLTFKVPKNAPIASAGEDQAVGVGETAALDGTDTVSLRPGKAAGGDARQDLPPTYQWSLLTAPPGSEATIQDANTDVPALVPDVPGTYVALVQVSQGDATSVDDVRLTVSAEDDPGGIPIQTITDDGAIQVGDPAQPGSHTGTYRRQGNLAQMLVLSSDHGTPIPGDWDDSSGIKTGQDGVLAFNRGQGDRLVDAVKATKTVPSDLVVLSGQGAGGAGSADISSSDASDLKQAIELLGGTVDAKGMTPNGASDLGSGAWSLIGHYGLARGGANQNQFIASPGVPGFMAGDGGQPGSLNGYLQKVTTIGFQFISPEVIPIDTKWTPDPVQPPSPTHNTIKVGDKMYETGVVQEGDVWMHLLVLDQGTLEPVHNVAYRVIAANEQTDFSGIAQLSGALHRYATNRTTGASNLVILQDFGTHTERNWPAGNSADWVDDEIPDFVESVKWHGDTFPTGDALERSWNANHPNGTVAGNVGLIAGTVGHDVVANYRRPFFDQERREIIPRVTGGLTVVASTNLYQESSAFVQGQTHPSFTGRGKLAPLLGNGRIVGSLRRNNQSQLEMGATTLGHGPVGTDASGAPVSEPYGNADFAQVALRPPTPWPCTPEAPKPCPEDPARSQELVDALAYITRQTAGRTSGPDLREHYAEDTFAPDAFTGPVGDLKYDDINNPSFGKDVFTALQGQLVTELNDLIEVNKAFPVYQSLLAPDNPDFDITGASSQVTTALNKLKRDLPQKSALFDTGGVIAEGIFAASGIAMVAAAADPATFAFAPGALTFLGYAVEIGFKLDDFFDPKTATPQDDQVADDINLVKAETHEISGMVRTELDTANDTLKHFWDLIRTDPVRLSQARDNFVGDWELGTEEERRLSQAYAIGAQQQLWYAIAPLVFDQWALGPGHTDINVNGPIDIPNLGYNCRSLTDTLDGGTQIDENFNKPLWNVPQSMSTASSVAWSGNPGAQEVNAVGYLVRFLKFNASPNAPVVRTSDANRFQSFDSFLQKKGVSPNASLMDPIFEQTSDTSNYRRPTQLGISKDVFFGQPYWKLRKLQCGKRQ